MATRQNGAALYAGTSDGIHVFALDDLRRLRVIGEGSKARCEAVAVSAGGALLAGGGNDSPLRIWRADGEQVRTFAREKQVRALGFSPDGATLAAGSQDDTCRLWSVATGALQATLTQTNTIRDLAWCPDGSCLATICADGPLVIWNADGSTRHAIRRGGIGHRLAFSPSGAWLGASDTKGGITVYDARSGAVRVKLKARADPALGFAGEDHLLSGSKSIELWDLAAGTATTLHASKLKLGELAVAGERIVAVGNSVSGVVLDRAGTILVEPRLLIENDYLKRIAVG